MNWLKNKSHLTLFVLAISCTNDFNVKVESSNSVQLELLKKGNLAASEVFKVLSSELSSQMANGKEKAIDYCNVHALPLTDSISKRLNVEVKRTSNKLRNQVTRATDIEKQILAQFEKSSLEKPAKPIIQQNDGDQFFFKPIYTQPMCLTCHGSKEQIGGDLYSDVIETLYPKDKAINFKLGELRGMWSIKFLNN
tara:strand:- start:731 stop:1315 length:585 start_codon:yes stop_codon:yes gene_type:complete